MPITLSDERFPEFKGKTIETIKDYGTLFHYSDGKLAGCEFKNGTGYIIEYIPGTDTKHRVVWHDIYRDISYTVKINNMDNDPDSPEQFLAGPVLGLCMVNWNTGKCTNVYTKY